MDYDAEKIDEAALALLYLTLHDTRMVERYGLGGDRAPLREGIHLGPGEQAQADDPDGRRPPGGGSGVSAAILKAALTRQVSRALVY